MTPFILGINGSPNRDGVTAQTLAVAMSAAREVGAEVFIEHLSEDLPYHDGRREEETHSVDSRIARLPVQGGLRDLVITMRRADGIIFATSTHCFNPSSRIMTLLGWLMVTTDAPEHVLQGKAVAAMSVCEEDGAQQANNAILAPLNHMGCILVPFANYFRNRHAFQKSEGNWQETHRRLIGLNVVRLVKLLDGRQGNWLDSSLSW